MIWLYVFYGFTTQSQVLFPTDSSLCEDALWRLVWHDEFNDQTIDTSKWYTFSDDENWFEVQPGVAEVFPYGNSRLSRLSQGKVIYRDENVMANGSTCTLRSRYQPGTWSGSGWNESRHFTSGMLLSKDPGLRHTLYFNKGRFDMRARLPYQSGAWATFWLYGGGRGPDPTGTPPFEGQNGCEIDMIEYNPCVGGGDKVTGMDDLPWNMHGQNRGRNHGENHDIGGSKNVSNLGDWHLYSTEWDDNYIRFYVDGYLRHIQPRYTISKFIPPIAAPCVTRNEYDYHEDAAQVFPRPDEGMKLVLTNDITDNIYSENVLGFCTPIPDWIKSHDNIDAEWRDADFEIDYVRVYQREGKVQPGFENLCPKLEGETAVCQPSTQAYTYSLRGHYTNLKWTINAVDGIITQSTDTSVTVRFRDGNYSTTVTAAYLNTLPGCEQYASTVSVRVGPPAAPEVSANIMHVTGQRYQNELRINNAAKNTSYTWSIAESSAGGVPETRIGERIKYVSSYTPLLYSVSAANACGSILYSNALEPDRFNGGISRNADYVFPNPAREAVLVNFSDDYFSESRVVWIQVTDSYGKIVMKAHSADSIVQIPLSIQGLLPGVYTIEITGQKKRGFVKLVKL